MARANRKRLLEDIRQHFSDGWALAQRRGDMKFVTISPKGVQYVEGEVDCLATGYRRDYDVVGDFYVFVALYDNPRNPDSLAKALRGVLGD